MDNPQGAVDVPLSLYSGHNLELAPSDIPEGVSPGCQDVIFLPGSVQSRPGLHRIFSSGAFAAGGDIVYENTYLKPDGTSINLYLDSLDGSIHAEDLSSPGTVSIIGYVAAGSLATSVTAFGREYLAFSDGRHGTDLPLQYDGVHLDPVTQDGPGAPPTSVADSGVGVSTVGVHQCVVMFLTRQGFITKPSPPVSFTSVGTTQFLVTGIPIGPPNVMARILAFTGAGGDNFFYIPVTPTVGGVVVGTSTMVNDNTTQTVTVNFADNTLFNATAIDIPGNNLFEMVTLPPCLGVFSYSQRMMFWGMDNAVTNFLNMDFDGGYISDLQHPTGWTVVGTGGLLVAGASSSFSWEISGTGSPVGELSQPAYQDAYFVPILQPDTQYTFKANGLVGSSTGNLIAELYSAGSGGVLASATIPMSAFHIGTIGAFGQANFTAKTPAVIPTDLVFRFYASGLLTGVTLVLDKLEVIYTDQPYINSRALMSYVGKPEQFDGLTGQIGPATDPTPIMCCTILKDTMRIKTLDGIHQTTDNGTSEPSGWTVASFSRTVGAVSVRAGDPGRFGSGDTAEDWDLTAARGGLYIDFGGDLFKISQEVQNGNSASGLPGWDSINWKAAQTLWIKNDPVVRRAYVGAPIGTATTPNYLFVWDYRELDAAMQIANAAPIHISFTGKMIASDLARKWTGWNLPMLSGEILNRSNAGNDRQMCFGGKALFPNGNVYYLDAAKLTDDDFGQIYPFYTTYAFLNHEAEVALGTGVHRKLYRYLTLYASGVGNLTVVPLVDSLQNSWSPGPAFPLQLNPDYDIEWGLNVLGERCFLMLSSSPITGTDNSFQLNKMVVSIQASPYDPVRGGW